MSLISVHPGDISTALVAAPAGSIVQATEPGQYVIGKTINLLRAAVTLDVLGNPLSLYASSGASSNIVVGAGAAHFTIKNFKAKGAGCFVLTYADFTTIQDGVFADGFLNAAKTDGGRYLNFLRNKVGKTNSVAVYVESDGSVIDGTAPTNASDPTKYNSSFAGSAGEYDVRYEVNTAGRKPIGGLLRNTYLYNHNSLVKNGVGPRMIDNWRMTQCLLDCTIRFGQVPGAGQPPITNPNLCNANAVIDHCVFVKSDPGNSPVAIFEGSTVAATAITFGPLINEGSPPFVIATGSVLAATACTQQVYQGEQPKRLVAISSTGTYHLTNNGVVYVPKPAA